MNKVKLSEISFYKPDNHVWVNSEGFHYCAACLDDIYNYSFTLQEDPLEDGDIEFAIALRNEEYLEFKVDKNVYCEQCEAFNEYNTTYTIEVSRDKTH